LYKQSLYERPFRHLNISRFDENRGLQPCVHVIVVSAIAMKLLTKRCRLVHVVRVIVAPQFDTPSTAAYKHCKCLDLCGFYLAIVALLLLSD
jgi:hypothetical protein